MSVTSATTHPAPPVTRRWAISPLVVIWTLTLFVVCAVVLWLMMNAAQTQAEVAARSPRAFVNIPPKVFELLEAAQRQQNDQLRADETMIESPAAVPSAEPMVEVEAEATNSDQAVSVATQIPKPKNEPPPPPPGSEKLPRLTADPLLQETTDFGIVPKRDGARSALNTYGRPVLEPVLGSSVVVVVQGLGMSGQRTQAAVRALPPEVTLAFSPYATNLDYHMVMARKNGHETWLEWPLEPERFPLDDPGPLAALASLSPQDNNNRLMQVLGKAQAYPGVITHMGSRIATMQDKMQPLLAALSERGLGLIDSVNSIRSVLKPVAAEQQLPFLGSFRHISEPMNATTIQQRLVEVERQAITQGYAVVVVDSFPLAIDAVATWVRSLAEKGVTVVPASYALLNPPAIANTPPSVTPTPEMGE